MWFILKSLPQMPPEQLHDAGTMLTEGLKKWGPAAVSRHPHRRITPSTLLWRN
ncbi:B3/4 domain-containing protein [Pantoea ananatis LMG 5342]|nr:B3/4 domain-containing protein [Pantoea ananatis LMG 5342]